VGRAFQKERLPAQVMVAQHLAVVGGEDDKRVLQQVKLAQPGKELAQIVVDLRDQGVVGAG